MGIKEQWLKLRHGPISGQVIAGLIGAGILGALSWATSEGVRTAIAAFLKALWSFLSTPLPVPVIGCLAVVGLLGFFAWRSLKVPRERKSDVKPAADPESAPLQLTGIPDPQIWMLLHLFEDGASDTETLKIIASCPTVGHAQAHLAELITSGLVARYGDDFSPSFDLLPKGQQVAMRLWDVRDELNKAIAKGLVEMKRDNPPPKPQAE